ncbi:FAD-dependent oxidoreductase (plasmid) [Streptomyces clavuligerus]|uniref:Putative amine oxidoreductase n=3 Tax=Streptomyces clavuligerus TaxID=1901 RepID=D5SLF6_STRCL|nr:FAD-dependent oxidoreductase [Streptomyces clavuligerus]ANW22615.1 amine oxidoreductase [Streptomyces clavuligerus]AXU16916.1 FAD-dependent oxidoreductase [Streptomyces clavuligerus]EFG04749.1 putative amine oxidoreductase [Streptomyces clavuligerus]MBY6306804.1 FAD-dependent oxidoreductase [Streptomyces clavuligerus]QCS10595.1 FAD-dependent oxidoreductase [Streptomyces clavuligerus]
MTLSTTAVIGSGVAGLTAGYLLERVSRVTLYEADTRLGGHAHTHTVEVPGRRSPLRLDSGFTVYNEHAYPLLTRLFAELGVPTRPTEMSLSAGCAGCGLSYATGSALRALPRGLADAGRPLGADLPGETAEFNRRARELSARHSPPGPTLGEFLAQEGFSPVFTRHVVLPLVGLVWSCGPEQALRYPVRLLVACLDHHGMLTAGRATRWRTVVGGSATYVRRVAARIGEIRTGTPVRAVRRDRDGVRVEDANGGVRRFDRVVIAVHPGRARALLTDPTPAENEILSAIPYTPTPAVLHTDSSVLPPRPGERSSWNHWQPACRAADGDVRLTYWLNRLHGLDGDTDYLVTLGNTDQVDPARVLARMEYEHPLQTHGSAAARARVGELTTPRTAYAGAWAGIGFHEDGCRSGAAAARSFGAVW